APGSPPIRSRRETDDRPVEPDRADEHRHRPHQPRARDAASDPECEKPPGRNAARELAELAPDVEGEERDRALAGGQAESGKGAREAEAVQQAEDEDEDDAPG